MKGGAGGRGASGGAGGTGGGGGGGGDAGAGGNGQGGGIYLAGGTLALTSVALDSDQVFAGAGDDGGDGGRGGAGGAGGSGGAAGLGSHGGGAASPASSGLTAGPGGSGGPNSSPAAQRATRNGGRGGPGGAGGTVFLGSPGNGADGGDGGNGADGGRGGDGASGGVGGAGGAGGSSGTALGAGIFLEAGALTFSPSLVITNSQGFAAAAGGGGAGGEGGEFGEHGIGGSAGQGGGLGTGGYAGRDWEFTAHGGTHVIAYGKAGANGNKGATGASGLDGQDGNTGAQGGDGMFGIGGQASNAGIFILGGTITHAQATSPQVVVTSSADPVGAGQSVTFTARVVSNSGTSTGAVTFMDGTTVLGTAPLNPVIAGSPQAIFTTQLRAGTHNITAVYSGDLNFNPATSAIFTEHIADPPEVTSVAVAGTTWSNGFRNALVAAGTGNGTGYKIPSGAAQLAPLGWGNLNQIQISFNTDVTLSSSSLSVTGDSSGGYAISGFSYSHTTHIATWTLARQLANDTIHLTLQSAGPSGVSDSLANSLDGEWTDGVSSYPSGDGWGSGNFVFAVRILGGDANGDDIVNSQDLAIVSSNWLKSSAAGDLNGDGIVNSQDLAIVSSSWLTSLPIASSGTANGLSQSVATVLTAGQSAIAAITTISPSTAPVAASTSTVAAQQFHAAIIDDTAVTADATLSGQTTTSVTAGTTERVFLGPLKLQLANSTIAPLASSGPERIAAFLANANSQLKDEPSSGREPTAAANPPRDGTYLFATEPPNAEGVIRATLAEWDSAADEDLFLLLATAGIQKR